MKKLLILIFFSSYLAASSPFLLTKISDVYPLVEINTKEVPKTYIKPIKEMIIKMANSLGIKTDGYSSRPLTIMITRLPLDNKSVIKISLLMGEEVQRLDDKEEVFAITYLADDIIEIDELEFELMESVEFLLESFKDQYIEDNE